MDWLCRGVSQYNVLSLPKPQTPVEKSLGFFYFMFFDVLDLSGCSTDGYMGLFWRQVFVSSNLATPTEEETVRISQLLYIVVSVEIHLLRYSVTVSTKDFESFRLGSNPSIATRETVFKFFNRTQEWKRRKTFYIDLQNNWQFTGF